MRLPRPSLSPALLPAALRSAALRPWLFDLPGAAQRRRALVASLLAILALVLRPWPPFLWLPGWAVGGLLLWAVGECLLWSWRPRRWR